MKFRVWIYEDEDGVFVAEVPSLPGCISQGATRAEALHNVKEAIEGYLDSLCALTTSRFHPRSSKRSWTLQCEHAAAGLRA